LKARIIKFISFLVSVSLFSIAQIYFLNIFHNLINSPTAVYFTSFFCTTGVVVVFYTLMSAIIRKVFKISLGYQLYDYKKVMDDNLESLENSGTSKTLANKLLLSISRQVKVQSAAIFISEGNSYLMKAFEGVSAELYNYDLRPDNLLVRWLKYHKKPLFKSELLRGFDSHMLAKEELSDLRVLYQEVKDLQIHVAIPVFINSKLVGIFTVGKPVGKLRFSKEDIDFLTQMAKQVIAGSERITLEDKMNSKVKEIMMLQKVGKIINSHADINIVLQMLTKNIVEVMDVSRGILMIYNHEEEVLENRSVYGFSKEWRNFKIEVKYRKLARIFRNKQAMIIKRQHKKLLSVFTDILVDDCILIPIHNSREFLGVIVIDNYPLKLTLDASDQHLLGLFVSQVVNAIEKFRLSSEKNLQMKQLYKLNEEVNIVKVHTENILKNIHNAVIATDENNNVTVYNKAAQDYFGYSASDILGCDFEMLIKDIPSLSQVITAESSVPYSFDIVINRNNESLPIKGYYIPLKQQEVVMGRMFVLSDVSQIKDLEKQLYFSDRLSSIGTIAASMMHEIKNPLASLKMFSQVMSQRYADPDFWSKYGLIVVEEIDRLDLLVSNFLGFSKKQSNMMDEIQFSKLLDKVLNLVSMKIKRNKIRIITDVSEHLVIRGDEKALQQVIINMLINSEQAFAPDQEQKLITIKGFAANDKACISIFDNGRGIPVGEKQNIFNPFYTTKKEGTGLGLFISSRIISELSGTLTVESNEGQGTEFRIELPLCTQKLFEIA